MRPKLNTYIELQYINNNHMINNFSQQSTIAESIVSSKYNQQIDIMKGLAILLVVAGHIIQFSVVGGG